jgi:hypothetical protein
MCKNPLDPPRKPFISDPWCATGGYEVMDLGRVINSNLMGKAGSEAVHLGWVCGKLRPFLEDHVQ